MYGKVSSEGATEYGRSGSNQALFQDCNGHETLRWFQIVNLRSDGRRSESNAFAFRSISAKATRDSISGLLFS
jgi:hypothetical protein